MTSTWGRFGWLALATTTLAVGCGIVAAPDRDKIPQAGSGGSGGIGGGEGGNVGGNEGGGGNPECTSADDCTDGTECQTASCDDGSCSYTNNDGDMCSAGFCNGDACVECLIDDHCPGNANVCNPGTNACEDLCANGALDGMETATDCGGPDCAACANGDDCVDDSDCQSGFCDDGQAMPVCAACGSTMDCPFGTFCEMATMTCIDKLMFGAICNDDTECAGGDCVDGVCCENSCNDDCEACDMMGMEGQCVPHAAGTDPEMDCGADVCGGGPACRCANGAMDGMETDTDCGGGVCPTCGTGDACMVPADCTSGVCTGNVCQ